ncbi:hypothetical protein Q4595_19450, partial [Wenyingzhuangia sp. 1_MG-2023]|nr:hypothetical protein [Wenyingzhuangia sp. 1_MG-2023]
VDINPHRLQQVEQRLSDIFSMARKHQIQPTELYDHWQQQEAALAELSMSDEDLAELQEQVIALEQRYLTEAQTLSQARIQAAARLDANVCDQFDAMALGRTRFETHINPLSLSEAGKHGIDQIRFMVQTNPGMPAGPLAKVASGGEL